MFRLNQKKRILITGHSRGIGYAITIKLLSLGYDVIGISRSTCLPLDHLSQWQYDLSNPEDVIKTCNRLKKENLHSIILNAGANTIKVPDAYKANEVIDIIQLNLTTPAALINTCLPTLIKNKGNIIGIGSFSGIEIQRFNNFYGAAKSGFHHLLKNIFEQYRKQGLRVTNIIPDIVKSSFYDHQEYEPGTENDTFIQPEEIAEWVIKILTDNSNTVIQEIILRPQKFSLIKK